MISPGSVANKRMQIIFCECGILPEMFISDSVLNSG